MAKPKLIKSTSGIRGVVGNGLDPVLVTSYGAAFGTFLKRGKVVVGRDSRPSGDIFSRAVISGLVSVGIDVIEIGIVPTPTVEIAVKALKAAGGICITASHNPSEWNAIKFFNDHGEFITAAQYRRLDNIFESGKFALKPASHLGSITRQDRWVDEHIKRTLAAKAVNRKAIMRSRPKIVIDAINGAGSVAMPDLLRKLGAIVVEINCKGDGNFVHKPEPTTANLAQLSRAVKKHKADLGMACDPDADRLALVDENGLAIGEELTLAIVVGHVLGKLPGPTVINLSTSKTTADVAISMGSTVHLSKVGEANVVEMMHKKKAVIGGEGNGGVIYPSFHAGRDALIAASLILSALAEQKKSLATLVETLPRYYTIKSKASLPDDFAKRMKRLEKDVQAILGRTKIDRRDGLRFDFENGWVQIRSSNTEPIFRLIVETNDRVLTGKLSRKVMRYFR
jgi:phosphomannomutase